MPNLIPNQEDFSSRPAFDPGEKEDKSNYKIMYLLDIDILKVDGNLTVRPAQENNLRSKLIIPYFNISSGDNMSEIKKGLENLLDYDQEDDKRDKIKLRKYNKNGRENSRHSKIATSMSLNFKKNCILVLNLKIGNAYFSSSSSAVSLKNSGSSLILHDLMRVLEEAGSFDPVDDVPANRSADCKVAYLYYDYESARAAGNEGFHPFNIHVDIVDTESELTAKPYIPIVIDPDVRFPGGNEDP